jgi:transposase
VRELRELVRHRAKLVAMRSNCKAQIHAVLAKCGVAVPMGDLFGVGGTELLDGLDLPKPYTARIASLRRLIDLLDFEIGIFAKLVHGQLARDPGDTAVQTIPGIGDVHRFRTAQQLGCWAGMTPKHHESDTKVRRGRITKQGSRLVRWAVAESVQTLPKNAVLGMFRDQAAARRGTNIAVVAAARRQLEYVFYALRDHHVRGLEPRPTAPPAAVAS